MSIPSWVKSAIFYQIFPDRFSNGDPSINPVNIHVWKEKPTGQSFFGGDLKGIEQRLDHIVELGANAIYLNPIFMSPSTHRYNTVDYFQIDPKLGDNDSFTSLINKCHSMKIKVILDGVFNHCGRGFFAFSDILENGTASPYKNWFHIKKFPVDAYSPGDAIDYEGWWKHKSLPKFNTSFKQVRDYIFRAADYWIKMGADGWRLDVPNEINDDGFWKEFREIVKAANSEAYLLGEIWDINPRWVGDSHFDGLMNYPLRSAIIELLTNKISSFDYNKKLTEQISAYPMENNFAMMNLLGSHDVERIITLFQKDLSKVKQSLFLLMTSLGCPNIYYGDEIGLEGGKDPDCRRTFPWDEVVWNHEIYQWTRKLIRIRKDNQAFSNGDYRSISFPDFPKLIGFTRTYDSEMIIGLLNLGDSKRSFDRKLIMDHEEPNHQIVDMLTDHPFQFSNEISINSGEMMLIKWLKF